MSGESAIKHLVEYKINYEKIKVAIAGYGIVGKKRHLYINENPN